MGVNEARRRLVEVLRGAVRPGADVVPDGASRGIGGWLPHGRDATAAERDEKASESPGDDQPAWTREFDSLVSESVAVADGLVYGAAGEAAFALDAATGETRWRRQLRSGFATGGVVVADGVVYATTTGGAVALDAATGEFEWAAPLDESSGVGVATGAAFVVPLADGSVVALDAVDGTERWRLPLGRNPVVERSTDRETVFVGSRDGPGSVVAAVTAADGDLTWSCRGPGAGAGVTAMATGRDDVYASIGGECYALDATDGTERWRTSDVGLAAASVADGALVGLSDDGCVVGLDGESGGVVWESSFVGGSCTADTCGSVSATDGTVYATGVGDPAGDGTGEPDAGSSGLVAGFDAETGRRRFEATVDAELPPTRPAVEDGRVVVSTFDGTYRAFE